MIISRDAARVTGGCLSLKAANPNLVKVNIKTPFECGGIVDLAGDQRRAPPSLASGQEEKTTDVKASRPLSWFWSGFSLFMGRIKLNVFFNGITYAFGQWNKKEKKEEKIRWTRAVVLIWTYSIELLGCMSRKKGKGFYEWEFSPKSNMWALTLYAWLLMSVVITFSDLIKA